jgi:hypothetical protein
MKKYYFFKDYLIAGDSQRGIIRGTSTVEVDFAQIEQELPIGAQIKIETLQTVVEGGRFLVYGEYTLPVSMEELVAKDSIDLDQVLGDEESLPSLN